MVVDSFNLIKTDKMSKKKKTSLRFILKNENNEVYAPYGNCMWSDVYNNADMFKSKTRAIKKAKELVEDEDLDTSYIQIVDVLYIERK